MIFAHALDYDFRIANNHQNVKNSFRRIATSQSLDTASSSPAVNTRSTSYPCKNLPAAARPTTVVK